MFRGAFHGRAVLVASWSHDHRRSHIEVRVLKYDRNRALRHLAAAAFIVVVAGLFVRQQLEAPVVAPGGVLGGVALGPLDERTVEVGQPAPDFVLEARGRAQPLRLSDFRGKVVVLNFWASWCGPCRQEMPEFQAEYARRGADPDVVILAVNALSLDVRRDAERFIEEMEVTFPVVFDAGGDVGERYRVRGLPSTFFIDRGGVVRAATFGPAFGGLLSEGIAKAEAGGG
jgi:cytochrome c biogenesis protein CcmG, thiol:disulfide interchange protein DsbE